MTSAESHYPEPLVEVVAEALEAAYLSGLTLTPAQAKEHDARSVLAALARRRALVLDWPGPPAGGGRFALIPGEAGAATLQLDGRPILLLDAADAVSAGVAELVRRSDALDELEWRLAVARRRLDETRPHLLSVRGQLGKILAAQLLEWEIGVQQLVGGGPHPDAAAVKTPWD